MKYSISFFMLNFLCLAAFCQNKVSLATYEVPDSIKAIAFYAEVKITEGNSGKKNLSGISTNGISLVLSHNKKQKVFQFSYFAKPRRYIVHGMGTDTSGNGILWNYNWQENEIYPLLIATASDSATRKTIYSGYVFLPIEKKWKLIATHRFNDTIALKYLSNVISQNFAAAISNRWIQCSDGSLKALDSQTTRPPSLRQMSNIDSLAQQQTEEYLLRSKLPKDSVQYEEGMFYQTIKEGSGRFVKVTDTLTVHYKGSLFSDGSAFDQTTDKPATFPLERLIKGWQLGLLHCKVGGKMRLYLPSGSAYGIRTRSAEIPPNSILVFDVEVLDAKEKTIK